MQKKQNEYTWYVIVLGKQNGGVLKLSFFLVGPLDILKVYSVTKMRNIGQPYVNFYWT